MRRLAAVLLLITLAVVLLVAPNSVASAGSVGAVTVPFGTFQFPDIRIEPTVGSVILNSTGDGMLDVLINIDSLPSLVDYDVRIFVWPDVNPQIDNPPGNVYYPPIYRDVLETNAEGQGNAHLKVPIPDSGSTNPIWKDNRLVLVNIASNLPGAMFTTGVVVVPLK